MSVSFPLEGNNPPALLSRPPGQLTSTQWRGISFILTMQGYRGVALPGSYSTYRRIWANPTVAYVHATTRAVMKTPQWSVEADDDVPDEVVEFLERAFIKHKAAIINHGSTGRIFGRASWEKVWETDEDGYMFPRLKPLVADITVPMVDKLTGQFAGLKQDDGTVMGVTKCWHYAYDGEAEDPYGRSVLENIRCTAWRSWEDTYEKLRQYTTKAAGVIPIARAPLGTGQNQNGETRDNTEHAQTLLEGLGKGFGLVFPNEWSHEVAEIARENPKLLELLRWDVSFLEVASGHGDEFQAMLKADETRMVRGMLWPERALTEGQFGTKAESGVQMDVGLTICEQDIAEFVEDLNRDVVDDALEANWGSLWKGKARIKVGPLRDTDKEFFRALIHDLLLNPTALEVASQIIDLDAHLDQSGFTKAKEIVDVGQIGVQAPPALPPGAPQPPRPPQPENQPPVPPNGEPNAGDPIAASRDVVIPPGAVPSVEATPEQEKTTRETLTGMVRRWFGR